MVARKHDGVDYLDGQADIAARRSFDRPLNLFCHSIGFAFSQRRAARFSPPSLKLP
jgi:hypothetical protein